MFFLTVLSLLVVSAWSQQAGMMTTMSTMMSGMKSTMPPPKPCCLPETWQGTVVDLKSQYDLVSTVVRDMNKMLQGSLTTMRGSEQVLARSLIDYGKQMIYSAEYPSGQAPTCKKEPFPMPQFRCMNSSKLSDVTYLGSSTVGMKGMGIDYDGYSFKGGDFEFSAALSKISGSDNMCYPVLENVKLPGVLDSLYLFLDMTTTIDKPSILTIPAPCVGSNAAVVG